MFQKAYKFIVDNLQYKMPVYITLVVLIASSFVLVSCHIIPVSYVTTEDQKNISRVNSIQQIEFMRRFETMDAKTMKEFLIKNVEFAIEIEKVICGSAKESPEILKSTLDGK